MREMRTATSPQFDPAALAAARRLPVESAVPGTTLAPIPLRAFAAGGILYGAAPAPAACGRTPAERGAQ